MQLELSILVSSGDLAVQQRMARILVFASCEWRFARLLAVRRLWAQGRCQVRSGHARSFMT
jgi:hypothetical protein